MRFLFNIKKNAIKITVSGSVICIGLFTAANVSLAQDDQLNLSLGKWFKNQINHVVNDSIDELDQAIRNETILYKRAIENKIVQGNKELHDFQAKKEEVYINKMEDTVNQMMVDEQLQGEQELREQLELIISDKKDEINKLLKQ